MPVLMLTRATGGGSRQGLQAGADDYLVKPSALSNCSRVQALLRRGAIPIPPVGISVIRLADLVSDLFRRKATRAGQRLDLTAKEFLLMTCCCAERSAVRTAGRNRCGDMNFDSNTNVVEVAGASIAQQDR